MNSYEYYYSKYRKYKKKYLRRKQDRQYGGASEPDCQTIDNDIEELCRITKNSGPLNDESIGQIVVLKNKIEGCDVHLKDERQKKYEECASQAAIDSCDLSSSQVRETAEKVTDDDMKRVLNKKTKADLRQMATNLGISSTEGIEKSKLIDSLVKAWRKAVDTLEEEATS